MGKSRSGVRRPSQPMRTADDFWRRVDVRGPDECWPWMSTECDDGYGILGWKGRTRTAHSVAYELSRCVEIPKRGEPGHIDVDHTCHSSDGCIGGPDCRHRRCCNPAHLLGCSHQENCVRTAFKVYCKRGHLRTADNLTKDGGCKTCVKLRNPGPRPLKTHCLNGHPRTPENLDTHSACRICGRERARQQKIRRREAMSS